MPDPVVAISAGPGLHGYGTAGELLNRLRDHEPSPHRVLVLDAERDPDTRPWPDGPDVLRAPGGSPTAALMTALAHAHVCAPGALLVWLDAGVDLVGPVLGTLVPEPGDGLLEVTGPAWRCAPDPPRVPRVATRPGVHRTLAALRAEAASHGAVAPAPDGPLPAIAFTPALIDALGTRRLLHDPARWRHAPLGPQSLARLLVAATGLTARTVRLPSPVSA